MGNATGLSCIELGRRYEELGQTARQIGLDCGCSASTVSRQLKACGIVRRSGQFQARALDAGEIARLYLHERLPIAEIARRLGVSSATVWGRLRAAGTPRRERLVATTQLRALWQQGLPLEAVAALGGTSLSAVALAIAQAERRRVYPGNRSPTLPERAYLGGLRRAGLAAVRADDASGDIVAYALATSPADEQLYRAALGALTPPRQLALQPQHTVLLARFPASWSFLLASDDRVPLSIRAERLLLLGFVAALVDAQSTLVGTPPRQALLIRNANQRLLEELAADLAAPQLRTRIEHRGDEDVSWRLRLDGPGLPPLLAVLAPFRLRG